MDWTDRETFATERSLRDRERTRRHPLHRRYSRFSQESFSMKAIAVLPGKPNSVHLADLNKPSVHEVPGGRGVLVRVLRVGVDGTDKEINAAEYGTAPNGYNFLVLGHESFGLVEEVGEHVTELQPGD